MHGWIADHRIALPGVSTVVFPFDFGLRERGEESVGFVGPFLGKLSCEDDQRDALLSHEFRVSALVALATKRAPLASTGRPVAVQR